MTIQEKKELEIKGLKYVKDYFNDMGNLCAHTDAILIKHSKVKIEKSDKDTIKNIESRLKDLLPRTVETLNGMCTVKCVMVDINGTNLEEGIKVYDDSGVFEGTIVGITILDDDETIINSINYNFY